MNENELDATEDMSDLPDAEESQPMVSQRVAGPGEIKGIFDRMPRGMAAMRGGKSIIAPRTVSFMFDGASGAPGVFADSEGEYYDVEVCLRSLTAADELEVMNGLKGGGTGIPLELTKRALWSIAGSELKSAEQREFMWEALGSAGRQLCLMAFQTIGGATGVDLGKYQRTFTVG